MRASSLAPLYLCIAGGLAFLLLSEGTKDYRLRMKAYQAQAAVGQWLADGQDPSAAVTLMQRVRPLVDAGHPREAEALLDQALSILKAEPNAVPSTDVLPEPAGSDLYVRPEPVVIEGYDGTAMEPFLAPDGRFLFFNNANDAGVNTNLLFAERRGETRFVYRGELGGANSSSLDAAPSLDRAGHLFFTSLREYDRTHRSIFVGDFGGQGLRNVHPVDGDIHPSAPGAVNMDMGISADGHTLYISRAVFGPGGGPPLKSELMVAVRGQDGSFHLDPHGGAILQRVNGGALQYAPCISADGRELYFTRAVPHGSAPSVRILVAVRGDPSAAFGAPQVLQALTGFVEAPTVSLDGKEMFFHRKVGDRYVIYRAVRKPRR